MLSASPSCIEQILSQMRIRIEETLSSLVPDHKDHLLFQAARYSLFSPAKRLRPLLVMIAAESLGADPELALYPACALEMMHTYSLIHDDLPCMDDDNFRRGQPTLHRVYEEGHAVLTGDFLLTYAFEVIGKSPNLTAEQRLELTQILAIGGGSHGIIGGQVLDLAWKNTNFNPTWDELSKMQIKKTSALFSAALEMGAIIANSSTNDRSLLANIGTEIGLAFQIVDDLIDGDGACVLIGREKAEEQIEELFRSVTQKVEQLSLPCPLLSALFEKLIHRVF